MSVDEVVERIVALRRVTEQTGCITRRTQSELLASLPNDVLLEVSLRLNRIENERNRHEPQLSHRK